MLTNSILNVFAGDSNMDGIFSSTDLTVTFIAGEYEDAQESNSTWATGDWNCDGEFNSGDIVFAFEVGRYDPTA